MKMTVPLTGTNVTPEGAGPQPGATPTPAPPTETPAQTQQPTGRPSLHQARMLRPPAQQQEVKAEFDKFGRVKWVPVEQAQAQEPAQTDIVADVDDSTVDAGGGVLDGVADVPPQDIQVPPQTAQTFDGNALAQQVNQLTQLVNVLAQAQLGGLQQQPQKPQAPQPPNPADFDLYDPQQFAEFNKLNTSYIQATVRHEVNAALEPHGEALQGAQWNRDVNTLLSTRGNEPNFKANMDAAIRLVARNPNRFSIPEAYEIMASVLPATSPQKAAAPSPSAKPAQRTMTAQEAAQKAEQAKRLPASQGVSGTSRIALPSHIRTLGAIMEWNRQNGRAN